MAQLNSVLATQPKSSREMARIFSFHIRKLFFKSVFLPKKVFNLKQSFLWTRKRHFFTTPLIFLTRGRIFFAQCPKKIRKSFPEKIFFLKIFLWKRSLLFWALPKTFLTKAELSFAQISKVFKKILNFEKHMFVLEQMILCKCRKQFWQFQCFFDERLKFLCSMSKSPKKMEKIQVFLMKRFSSKS